MMPQGYCKAVKTLHTLVHYSDEHYICLCTAKGEFCAIKWVLFCRDILILEFHFDLSQTYPFFLDKLLSFFFKTRAGKIYIYSKN